MSLTRNGCASRHRQLALLTLSYVVGELSHFLIGVVSREAAREVGYGDKACFNGTSVQAEGSVDCSSIRNEER